MTQRRAGRSLPACPAQAASGPDVEQASACASVYPVRGHSDLPPPEPCARPTSTKRCVAEIGRSTDQGGAAARRRARRSPRRPFCAEATRSRTLNRHAGRKLHVARLPRQPIVRLAVTAPAPTERRTCEEDGEKMGGSA